MDSRSAICAAIIKFPESKRSDFYWKDFSLQKIHAIVSTNSDMFRGLEPSKTFCKELIRDMKTNQTKSGYEDQTSSP